MKMGSFQQLTFKTLGKNNLPNKSQVQMENLRVERYAGLPKEVKFMSEISMVLSLFGMPEIPINYVKYYAISVVLKAHDLDITKVHWLEEERKLVTASKDKRIKVWQFPQFWRDPKVMEKEHQIEHSITFKKLRESLFQNQKVQIDINQEDNEENGMILWDQPQKKYSGNSFEDQTELK